jgi:hypothetical protein
MWDLSTQTKRGMNNTEIKTSLNQEVIGKNKIHSQQTYYHRTNKNKLFRLSE